MKTGTCLLCGKFGELAKISHIIPKFMYKGMENQTNKIAVTILKDSVKTETEIEHRYFDKNIICLDCERVKLSQLDNYGNRVLFGDQKLIDSFRSSTLEYPEMKVCMIENFDYLRFKLFLLSVLWRANISKQMFFENINLSSRAELLRQAILSKDLSLCEDVRISIFGLMFDRNKLMKVIPKPRHIITESIDVYLFMIYGIVYNFIYKDDDNAFKLGENTLQENQPLKMPFYLGTDAMNYFRAFVLLSGN